MTAAWKKISMDGGFPFHEEGKDAFGKPVETPSEQTNLPVRRTAMKTNWPAFGMAYLILAKHGTGEQPCGLRSPPAGTTVTAAVHLQRCHKPKRRNGGGARGRRGGASTFTAGPHAGTRIGLVLGFLLEARASRAEDGPSPGYPIPCAECALGQYRPDVARVS